MRAIVKLVHNREYPNLKNVTTEEPKEKTGPCSREEDKQAFLLGYTGFLKTDVIMGLCRPDTRGGQRFNKIEQNTCRKNTHGKRHGDKVAMK